MKNAKQLAPALVVLLLVSLSCTLLKDKFSDLGGQSVEAPHVPAFDPNGKMASPGAYILRIMARDEPGLAVLINQVEAAEQKMMREIIDENRTDPQTDSTRTSLEASPAVQKTTDRPSPSTPAALLMFQARDLSLPGSGDGALFGGFTGFLKGMLADAVRTETFSKKDQKTETVEGGTSTMNAEIGANPDGSTIFEIGIVTETEKNGIKARTELKSRIEGQDCPNAEGQVPLTIKLRLNGQSGSSRYEQDITALVRVVVDDNADISSRTIDVTQATARGRNGSNVFIETSFTYQSDAGQSEATISNQREIRVSDNSTTAGRNEAANSGYSVALGAANAAISAAESAWQNGACIQIVATSPGTVGLNSTTSIPVKVVHRKEGMELPAKLESELKGDVSVDPALIPKTPGTLTYVAPGEPARKAVIGLKAACRRGRAQLYLKADTGAKAYRIEGKSNGVSFEGVFCDNGATFSLDATFPGGTATVSFVNDKAGSTITRGGGGGCKMEGEGTYKLVIGDDDTGTLNWTTTDKLTCPGFGNSRTASFSLPVKPAPDHYCR